MSTYQRPLRSDELMHWGRKGFHKYIEKIGNRYFYTPEEVRAYKLAHIEGSVKAHRQYEEASKLRSKADTADRESSRMAERSKAETQAAKKANRKATYAYKKEDRDEGLKEFNQRTDRAKFLSGREQGLKRTAEANRKVASSHDDAAKIALDEAKRKKENIVKDKSLLTKMAFKRAVEKEDREKKKKKQREAGRKRVEDWFRKKGWIY